MAYTSGPAIRPEGLGLAAGTTLLALSAIWLAAPNIVASLPKPTTLVLYPVADPPPPPPPEKHIDPKPARETARETAPPLVDPVIDTLSKPTEIALAEPRFEPVTPLGPIGAGTDGGGAATVEAKPKPPLLVPPMVDPRYAASFQPDYPAGEIRLEREGVVIVGVLIGTDGRVKALEPVSATSEEFLAATRRRAFTAWRFKPATRDGVAYEEWKQMRVTFTLKDG
ncbi:MAG: hypothetical protein A4S12_10895 [Proteobacteria bacterium SG_bin5]|nr:energy transducer TonB [Sphingomonas sp.]OQW39926.1 MAG: hypothetical protein A4S12_10895 [Proteobacteria bacterium SG_bin5]